MPVRLLDVADSQGPHRNSAALKGIQRQLSADGFIHPSCASAVEVGNLDDDLKKIADSDWIVEAIVEDLVIKRNLYARLEAVKRPDALVTSNTSTIPIRDLVEGRGPEFRETFLITHFFNPPRRMQLLEIVCGEATSVSSRAKAVEWGQMLLGKQVVIGKDTPGFIANRVGNYWMSVAALEAIKAGLSVSEADAIVSAPFGIPRTGVFGLFDFVGINLVPLVWRGLLDMLPTSDAHHAHDITKNEVFASLLERGFTGRFGSSGFYRRKAVVGAPVREMLDLRSRDYVPLQPVSVESSSLRELCERNDAAGRYAWSVLSLTVQYAACIAPEIAENLSAIDVAMKTGYNWRRGPFELADDVGAAWIVDRLRKEDRCVPRLLYQAAEIGGFAALKSKSPDLIDQSVLKLASVKGKSGAIFENESASIWDLGDGVACFEIHTKMNVCDPQVMAALREAVRLVPRHHQALVIGSDNERAFSAGANLDVFIGYAKVGDWTGLRSFVSDGQQTLLELKYAAFPSVAASGGLALGGGCELMLHCDRIVAFAELQAGFPELNAGIIPGWGGGTQILLRNQEAGFSASDSALGTFELVTSNAISGSALTARDARILRPSDHIVMSRAHLLSAAKNLASRLAENYAPPPEARISVSGAQGLSALQELIEKKRKDATFTEVDAGIAKELALALTGGDGSQSEQTEQQLMSLELNAIIELAKRPTTLDRLEHLRTTNKPLRN